SRANFGASPKFSFVQLKTVAGEAPTTAREARACAPRKRWPRSEQHLPSSRFAQRSGYNHNAMETFQSQLTRKLSEALSSAGFPLAGEVTPATDPRFGDYQSNAVLVLGKQRGENPLKMAEAIIANLDVTEISEQP